MTAAPSRPPTAARRLRRGADVRAVLSARCVAHGPALVVHARRRDDDAPARWTVVAGRKVGDAVRRNRAKRRLRAVLDATDLPTGTDLVVIARAAAVTSAHPDLVAGVEAQVDRAVARCQP